MLLTLLNRNLLEYSGCHNEKSPSHISLETKRENIFNRFSETDKLNHTAKKVSPLGVPPAPNPPLSP